MLCDLKTLKRRLWYNNQTITPVEAETLEILYVLIPLSIALITVAVVIFSWAVKSGQFDDLEGPAHSILFDDDKDMIPSGQDKSNKDDSKVTDQPTKE